ncbi:MAG: hypothetical protein IJB69_02405 [Clostridia bacterium]|nr:hypothetical protein [Clostridia bacterium]
MTLEELSVVFSADIGPFADAVSAMEGLVGQAGQIADSLVNEFTQAGYQAAQGLQMGLLSGKGGVSAAAAALAQAASASLRDALQIHSPSRVTREMGQMFDLGFLNGLMEDIPQVERESRALGQRAAAALEGAAPVGSAGASWAQPAQPVHVTLPLEIDGYRLGLAVIENLNRITQSTGRLELKL